MAREVRRQGDVLFEATRIGAVVRMAAIDPVTGTEAVIVGSATATLRQLQGLAARKLAFLLKRRDDAR